MLPDTHTQQGLACRPKPKGLFGWAFGPKSQKPNQKGCFLDDFLRSSSFSVVQF